jgi:hypothetical protein
LPRATTLPITEDIIVIRQRAPRSSVSARRCNEHWRLIKRRAASFGYCCAVLPPWVAVCGQSAQFYIPWKASPMRMLRTRLTAVLRSGIKIDYLHDSIELLFCLGEPPSWYLCTLNRNFLPVSDHVIGCLRHPLPAPRGLHLDLFVSSGENLRHVSSSTTSLYRIFQSHNNANALGLRRG